MKKEKVHWTRAAEMENTGKTMGGGGKQSSICHRYFIIKSKWNFFFFIKVLCSFELESDSKYCFTTASVTVALHILLRTSVFHYLLNSISQVALKTYLTKIKVLKKKWYKCFSMCWVAAEFVHIELMAQNCSQCLVKQHKHYCKPPG